MGEETMKKNFFVLVEGCQSNDSECFELLYKNFLPLLKKYSARFYDEEEAFDTLFYEFVNCLYKMPIHSANFHLDSVIIAYITTTIKNCYFALCKKENKRINTMCNYEDIKVADTLSNTKDILEDNLFMLSLEKYLSNAELELIKMKFCLGLKDAEIAKNQGISRQAVNRKLHKIIKKIKRFYDEVEVI